MQTTNGSLILNKIELSDIPDITVINPNFDKIDEVVTDIKTKKADKTYVDQKVANIVNAAPEALDTLKELSDALGNDPNFATTVSTQIGEKVDKVSGKELSTNDYTTEDKTKLNGIATNANNYTHPNDDNTRHVTDTEKATWNGKVSSSDVEILINNHDIFWNGHADMIGYHSELQEKHDTIVDALNSHTNKINDLKLSVSNGKNQIASTITDLGIDTRSTDSFAQMSNNMRGVVDCFQTEIWYESQPVQAGDIYRPFYTIKNEFFSFNLGDQQRALLYFIISDDSFNEYSAQCVELNVGALTKTEYFHAESGRGKIIVDGSLSNYEDIIKIKVDEWQEGNALVLSLMGILLPKKKHNHLGIIYS